MHRDGHFDYSLFLSRIICLPLTTLTLHNLVLALSFPPLANTRILSFPPDSIIRLSLSPSTFFLTFFLSFPSALPSFLSPPSHSLYTERRYTVGSTGPTCCSRVRAITISSRAFFATSRVLTSSLEEEMNWVIVKSCPAVIANACPGPRPATGFLNDRGSVLWSILKRRIVSRYIIVRDTKGFYLGKFYGEFPSWMVIINRLKRNNSFIFRWKTFEVLSLLV